MLMCLISISKILVKVVGVTWWCLILIGNKWSSTNLISRLWADPHLKRWHFTHSIVLLIILRVSAVTGRYLITKGVSFSAGWLSCRLISTNTLVVLFLIHLRLSFKAPPRWQLLLMRRAHSLERYVLSLWWSLDYAMLFDLLNHFLGKCLDKQVISFFSWFLMFFALIWLGYQPCIFSHYLPTGLSIPTIAICTICRRGNTMGFLGRDTSNSCWGLFIRAALVATK